MPTYHYHCSKCDKHWDEILKIAEMDNPLNAPCPECQAPKSIERIMEAPRLVEGVMGVGKMRYSGAYRDVMSKVKAAHPKGNWDKKVNGDGYGMDKK